MAQPTAGRREQARAATGREIRDRARRLLVEHGREALTLRAIAGELGMTAPALYRYYSSRAELVRAICDDVCADLATELRATIAPVPAADPETRAIVAFRGFRRWALAHREEFALVFGTPDRGDTSGEAGLHGRFGRVLTEVAGGLLASGRLIVPPGVVAPSAVRPALDSFRNQLVSGFAATGIPIGPGDLGPDAVYLLLQCWIRLYGMVALEVFGQLEFLAADAEPLFDALLHELAGLINRDRPGTS